MTKVIRKFIKNVEIKPGMTIVSKHGFYVAIPTKKGIGFIDSNGYFHNNEYNIKDIISIHDISSGDCLFSDSNILWKEKRIITKKEIAEKFGIDINDFKIE